MGKKVLVIFTISIIIVIGFIICIYYTTLKSDNNYRKIAWNSLNISLQQQVTGSWKNGKVKTFSQGKIWEISPFDDNQMPVQITKNKKIISVTFYVYNKMVNIGNIVVFIDPVTNKALGIASRS